MSIFAGIDGGGTRTTAVIVDEAGAEIARLEGAPGLVSVTDPLSGAEALADLAARALRAAGAEAADALCCALAGAGREEERIALEARLQRVAPAHRVLVRTDAEAALFDAFHGDAGILLIAGTGSIAWARTADGRTARTGGWGLLLGDEGSGYAIGLAALRSAVHAHDGRGVSTVLLDRILEHTGVADAPDLIRWAGAGTKAAIAALAPLIFAAGAEGDTVAAALLDSAASDLALHVSALYSRLQPWSHPPPVALGGGLITIGGPLRARLLQVLQSLPFQISIHHQAVDGARGAAMLARSLGNSD